MRKEFSPIANLNHDFCSQWISWVFSNVPTVWRRNIISSFQIIPKNSFTSFHYTFITKNSVIMATLFHEKNIKMELITIQTVGLSFRPVSPAEILSTVTWFKILNQYDLDPRTWGTDINGIMGWDYCINVSVMMG